MSASATAVPSADLRALCDNIDRLLPARNLDQTLDRTPGQTLDPSFDQTLDQSFDQTAFALFREPGQRPRLIVGDAQNCPTFAAITALKGRGFVMAPFLTDERTPVLLIRPIREASGWTDIANLVTELTGGSSTEHPLRRKGKPVPELTPDLSSELAPELASELASELSPDRAPELAGAPTPSYVEAFTSFLTSLAQGRFRKLVLSRAEQADIHASPALAFIRAETLYKGAMTFLVHTPVTGTWLGATPEILLSGAGETWRTMALAGTRPAGTTAPWDRKNLSEQAYVADYIRRLISPLSTQIREKGPFTTQAGNVQHLRTDFVFTPKDPGAALALTSALHPTPAVCGLPKEEAARYILEHEGHDRRYYSGFLGMWEDGMAASLYVNLRCMEMEPGRVIFHAGGGILPASTLETEWEETRQKMRTLVPLLQGNA